MADFCAPLKREDPNAHALCVELARRGYTLKELDQGFTRLAYPRNSKPYQVTEGKGDRRIAALEVYNKFIDIVENEENIRIQEYYKIIKNQVKQNDLSSQNHPLFQSKNLKILKEIGNSNYPFVFDDLKPHTPDDEKLFKISLKKINEIKEKLFVKGIKTFSVEYNKSLAIELFNFIQTSKSEGGLGIRFYNISKEGLRVDGNLGEIFSRGSASCVEFATLYYAIGRAAGLKVIPIEVLRNSIGAVSEHTRIGVLYDPNDTNKILHLDLSNPIDYQPKDTWVKISRLDLLSEHYNSRANAANDTEKGKFYRHALRYSPYSYMILTNYASWLRNFKSGFTQALSLLKIAKKVNPHYPFIDNELAALGKTKGY